MTDNAPFRDLIRVAGAVLVLTAAAGFGWKLISDRQPASADQSAAIAEQAEAMTQRLQDELTEQLASRPVGEQQQRMDSPLGQALLRKCVEWNEFHENHPDAFTLRNRDTACHEYAAFIATGKAPP